MRIAIATEAGQVAEHFGRCPLYTLVDLVDGQMDKRREIENPGHEPGRIPRLLRDHDVDVIIAGGMGQRAQMLFSQMDIEQIVGVTGSVDEVLNACLAGTLEGGESLCAHGEGHGDGTHGHGDHAHGDCGRH
ncbi:MAG: NifB/NifX family molybdenum-iron cluster-binding protein [bacterium]